MCHPVSDKSGTVTVIDKLIDKINHSYDLLQQKIKSNEEKFGHFLDFYELQYSYKKHARNCKVSSASCSLITVAELCEEYEQFLKF